jgi:hypothetical protein
MARKTILAACAALTLISAGASVPASAQFFGQTAYTLIRPGNRIVAAGKMRVTPTIRWNRAPRSPYEVSREENWTLNGPILDGLTFIGGLQSGRPLVRHQRRNDIRQVPNFRADMSPPEIASMIESFYRIRGGATRFEMTGLQPRTFLGRPGFQFDYSHLGGDEVERQGRAVGAVINNRFYLILFDAARMHYFPTGLPEVERIVNSAILRGS